MFMAKRRLNLTINEELLKKARKYDINISSFLEIKLREYIAMIEMSQRASGESKPSSQDISSSNHNRKNENSMEYSKNFKIPSSFINRASGLEVMTLPLRGKGRRFESGLAHIHENKFKN